MRLEELSKMNTELLQMTYKQGIVDGLTELKDILRENDKEFSKLEAFFICNELIKKYGQVEALPEEFAQKGMSQEAFQSLQHVMDSYEDTNNILASMPEDDIIESED